MVLAIEPMINMGTREVVQHDDGWTVATVDGKPSAHYEHTIAVRKGKVEVLTTFTYIEDVLKARNIWCATTDGNTRAEIVSPN